MKCLRNNIGFSTVVIALLILAVSPVCAQNINANVQIDWWVMVMGLFGGLALFLFGMEQMADSLKAVAGERMKNILARLTKNRVSAAISGAFVTAVIQSSSVTTVLVVGFITAGLMNVTQSIGVIMGANIGTTVTAQIVAFKVTEAALLMIAVGFAILFAAKREDYKHYGAMLMGLGLIFFGMGIMSNAMVPLREYQPFLDIMVTMESPLLGIIVAALFTALVQSSSATTGIVIVMASQGFITLPAGIAMALGANIGTCITALLASIGKPREAIRASLVHVLFNVVGAILWLGFITQLAELAVWVSPVHENLYGMEKLAAEAPRQIANANTMFNVANTVIFLPFTGLFAALVYKLLPDLPVEEKVVIKPKFLDDTLLSTPAMALERVRYELGRMGEIVEEMANDIDQAMLKRSHWHIAEVVKKDDQLDVLQDAVLDYLRKIHKVPLTDAESMHFEQLMNATVILEHMGDIIETDIADISIRFIDKNIQPSETMDHMLADLFKTVRNSLSLALAAMRSVDEQAAQQVLALQNEINYLVADVQQYQAKRMAQREKADLDTMRLEMDLLSKIRQMYTQAKRLARTVLLKSNVD